MWKKLVERLPGRPAAGADVRFDLPSANELLAFFERLLPQLTAPHGTDHEGVAYPPLGLRGRAFAWYWGFWGRALVHAYAATRQPRFLELFGSTWAAILAQRDDALGLADGPQSRILPGWATQIEGVRENEITVAGLMTLPHCELLLLLEHDPEAAGHAGITRGDAIETAAEILWQYEDGYRTTDEGGYYVHPVSGRVEALNHAHAFGAACVHLAAITGEARYREKAEALAAWFRASWTREPNGSLSWPYEPTPDNRRDRPAEAIWKAGTTLELPVAAVRHGLLFSGEDMAALTRTLRSNILTRRGINEFITSRATKPLGGARGAGKSLAGAGLAIWFLMPDPDGSNRTALLERMRAQPELFPNEWFGGARALVMAAAWLLREDARRAVDIP